MYISAIRVAAVGIGLAALAAPFPASAQSSPIAISSCTVLQAQVARPGPFWYPWGFGPIVHNVPVVDGLTISYSNVSTKVANRVAFAVNYRGDRQRVIDVGTFSPNAPITHMFGTFSGDAYTGPKPNYCRAIAVRFADGTIWQAAGVLRATP